MPCCMRGGRGTATTEAKIALSLNCYGVHCKIDLKWKIINANILRFEFASMLLFLPTQKFCFNQSRR